METAVNRESGKPMRLLIWGGLALAAGLAVVLGVSSPAQDEGEEQASATPTDAVCLQCHGGEGFVRIDKETGSSKSLFVDGRKFAVSVHAGLSCVDCHWDAETIPHTAAEMTPPACADCHSDEADQLAASVHASNAPNPDLPACLTCHDGNAHSVMPPGDLTRKQSVNLCVRCHDDEAMMKRNAVDPLACESYKRSFHYKAILFGSEKTAACVNCHGSHAILEPTNPKSPVAPGNVKETCGKCHKGAAPAFALSGVTHLDLKLKKTPVLRWEELLFRVLTISVLSVLILSIILDIRVGIAESWRRFRESLSQAPPAEPPARVHQWFTPWQRIQHWFFAASFFVLVATGLPLRFPEVPWMHGLYRFLGGLTTARLMHRVAAIVMISLFVIHLLYLLFTWKRISYSIKKIPLILNRRDWKDFVETLRFYFGLRREPPRFPRFSYRAKFGYWAVFWGLPIMAISGIILWFPVTLGSRLGELGVSAAYIAHSDEAVLAAGAIVIWHIYTVVFSPLYAPLGAKMFRGSLTDEELEREHERG